MLVGVSGCVGRRGGVGGDVKRGGGVLDRKRGGGLPL